MADRVEQDAGKLRHRVSILAVTTDRNAYREAVSEWSEVATVWAAVEPLSGRELWNAQQVQADVSHKVTIRYRDGLTPDMRVVHRGRTFDVRWWQDVEERRRKIIGYCVEQIGT